MPVGTKVTFCMKGSSKGLKRIFDPLTAHFIKKESRQNFVTLKGMTEGQS